MTSNAVAQNAVSAVVGYMLTKGNFNPNQPFLPQNISILAEANTANQSGLSTLPQVVTSAAQVGTIMGYGSPAYTAARILFPSTGRGVTIPVTLYPQLAASGAVAKVITITQTGTATVNRTIYLNICGREQVDGQSYAINVAVGDTPTIFSTKAQAAVASVLGCPVLGSGSTTFVATAKWAGLTSNDINIVIDQGPASNADSSVTFAVVNTTAGSGTPAISGNTTGLDYFGNSWNTMVINGYGLVSSIMTAFETYNGIPDPVNPTGQFTGTIMRPLWAFSGTCLDNPTSITSASPRPNNPTIVPCPAPLSAGLPIEAAANMVALCANVFSNTPQSDIVGLSYPDMPPPPVGSVPAMNTQATRDAYVKLGCSTVDYINGATGNGTYVVKDLVTTYNPSGEMPPFFRYVRDLNVFYNMKFRYHYQEALFLLGKTITGNNSVTNAANMVKPKDWVAQVKDIINAGVTDGLLTNAALMIPSITVTINPNNPGRFDTNYDEVITSVLRISATTAAVGFNYSNN